MSTTINLDAQSSIKDYEDRVFKIKRINRESQYYPKRARLEGKFCKTTKGGVAFINFPEKPSDYLVSISGDLLLDSKVMQSLEGKGINTANSSITIWAVEVEDVTVEERKAFNSKLLKEGILG